MGLFDYVDFEMPCPNCGKKVDDFQTKDGDVYMSTVDAFSVDSFYSSCGECGLWIEFNRNVPRSTGPVVKRSLDEVLKLFTMTQEQEE